MTIDAIRLFILTAKHLNITKAAREFRTTQSTASRRLTQFQTDLGMKLLKNSGRGIELTRSGRTYLNEVLPIFWQLQTLQEKYTPGQGCLTIAASYRPSKYLLPALMTEFSKKHPSAKLTLRTRGSLEIEKLLLDSKVDLAITTNPTVALSAFITEPYCHEPLTAFVAANHPLAQMKSLRASDSGTISIIIKSRRHGQSRVEAQLSKFEREGIKFKTLVRCESPEVVKEFVRHGAGVGFLYLNSIRRGIERGQFKAIPLPGLDLIGQNYIVYSKEKSLSRLAGEFLSFLRTSLTKNAPIKPTKFPTPIPAGPLNRRVGDSMRRSSLLF
jgi:DNA-binding transcriptional LysR family regulator